MKIKVNPADGGKEIRQPVCKRKTGRRIVRAQMGYVKEKFLEEGGGKEIWQQIATLLTSFICTL